MAAFALGVLALSRATALQLSDRYAFATRVGEGNPARVGVCDTWPSNPSEIASAAPDRPTAFARPVEDGGFELYYVAGDGSEMPFCGHATLAAADAVLADGDGAAAARTRSYAFPRRRFDRTAPRAGSSARLTTVGGKSISARRRDGDVELELDAAVAAPADEDAVAAATDALGGVEALDASFYDDTTLVVEVSRDAYAGLAEVDAAALGEIRLVAAATTQGSGDYDFRSRCFVRGSEDLACGVAHCGLGP